MHGINQNPTQGVIWNYSVLRHDFLMGLYRMLSEFSRLCGHIDPHSVYTEMASPRKMARCREICNHDDTNRYGTVLLSIWSVGSATTHCRERWTNHNGEQTCYTRKTQPRRLPIYVELSGTNSHFHMGLYVMHVGPRYCVLIFCTHSQKACSWITKHTGTNDAKDKGYFWGDGQRHGRAFILLCISNSLCSIYGTVVQPAVSAVNFREEHVATIVVVSNHLTPLT